MKRSYIGIEVGDHALTHCVPRVKKVIDGEQGGISEAVGWKGGGGFRFYRLGSPIFDEQGRINPAIRFDQLAAHIWFAETRTPLPQKRKRSPFLGVHSESGYYLLFNGILGDKSIDGRQRAHASFIGRASETRRAKSDLWRRLADRSAWTQEAGYNVQANPL